MGKAATHASKGCNKKNHDGRVFACHRGCEVKQRLDVLSLRKFSVLFLDFFSFFFARSPLLPVFKQWSVLTMCKSPLNIAVLVVRRGAKPKPRLHRRSARRARKGEVMTCPTPRPSYSGGKSDHESAGVHTRESFSGSYSPDSVQLVLFHRRVTAFVSGTCRAGGPGRMKPQASGKSGKDYEVNAVTTAESLSGAAGQ